MRSPSELPPAALARHLDGIERRRTLARALHEPFRFAAQLAALDARLAELRQRLAQLDGIMRAALAARHA